jgi:hypothetical protein
MARASSSLPVPVSPSISTASFASYRFYGFFASYFFYIDILKSLNTPYVAEGDRGTLKSAIRGFPNSFDCVKVYLIIYFFNAFFAS